MIFRLSSLLFSFVQWVLYVKAENKRHLHQNWVNKSFENQAKEKFGCLTVDEWKLINYKSNDEYVRNICIENSYHIYESPSKENLTNVYVNMYRNHVLEVDERRKSLTVLFRIWSIWQDHGIKVKDIEIFFLCHKELYGLRGLHMWFLRYRI